MNLDLSKHISFTSSSFVKQICLPLFSQLKFEYFHFSRKFIDGTEFILTTDPEWLHIYFEKEIYKDLLIDKGHVGNKLLINKVKILPWNLYPHSLVQSSHKKFSGICDGITVLFVYDGFSDFFNFGVSTKNQHMMDFYQNNADVLMNFCFQFKESAADLILLSKQERNRICIYDKDYFNKKNNELELLDINVEDIKSYFQPNQYILEINNETIAFSKKEMLCLQGICSGKSSEDLSQEFFLGKRTIDYYVERLKLKFKVNSKKDLIAICTKNYIEILNYLKIK